MSASNRDFIDAARVLMRGYQTPAAPPPTLRVVCAWCLTEMQSGAEPTSHGICERCTREVFRECR